MSSCGLAFGAIVDPNISRPLPFAGLSYVDFDLFGTGTQFNGFFGGEGFIMQRLQGDGWTFVHAGGTILGKTDEIGWNIVRDPVHINDLHATMLHLLGFDHERLMFRYAGRDFRLTDVAGSVATDILA